MANTTQTQLQETGSGCMATLNTQTPTPISAPQILSDIQQFLSEQDFNKTITINSDLEIHWNDESTDPSNRIHTPQIVDDLVKFLDNRGHSECIFIITGDKEVRWCKQDSCLEAGTWETIRTKNKQVHDLAAKLRSEGHTCVSLGQRMPADLSWCNNEPCLNC